MSNQANLQTAIFGGGCFWCIEPAFADLLGVHEVTPGYMGGHIDNPAYEQVCTQDTGHIEVVRVVFDPAVLSYETLLDVFFSIHDPTTPDRQGADVGPQYASAIFVLNDSQKVAARIAIDTLQQHVGAKVVTHLIQAYDMPFWPAELAHHDYYKRNPMQGYCQFVIRPKYETFRTRFAEFLKAPEA